MLQFQRPNTWENRLVLISLEIKPFHLSPTNLPLLHTPIGNTKPALYQGRQKAKRKTSACTNIAEKIPNHSQLNQVGVQGSFAFGM